MGNVFLICTCPDKKGSGNTYGPKTRHKTSVSLSPFRRQLISRISAGGAFFFLFLCQPVHFANELLHNPDFYFHTKLRKEPISFASNTRNDCSMLLILSLQDCQLKKNPIGDKLLPVVLSYNNRKQWGQHLLRQQGCQLQPSQLLSSSRLQLLAQH